MSVHVLRFFEREGLFLREISRSAGGRRIYQPADVDWLVLCDRFRPSGMPIAMIREVAELVATGPGYEPDRLELLREHERNVRAKIDGLNACRDVIHARVVVYEQHLRHGKAADLWSPRPSGRAEAGAQNE